MTAVRADEREAVAVVVDALAHPGAEGDLRAARWDAVLLDLADGTSDAVTAADLLAVALHGVDVRGWLPAALEAREGWSRLLAEVPADLDLRNAADDDLQEPSPLWTLWHDIAGVGGGRRWVTANVLCSRLRPRLAPVADPAVWQLVRPPRGGWWRTMRSALQQDGTMSRLAVLRAAAAVPDGVPDLRIATTVLHAEGVRRRGGEPDVSGL